MTGKSSLHLPLLLIIFILTFSGCGARTAESIEAIRAKAATGSGAFNGIWNVTLKPKKDTCQLGLAKSIKTTVTIVQKGKNATLTLEGLPPYKGKIDKSTMVATGKYNSSGYKTSGSVTISLSKNKKSVSISNAKINVKGTLNCSVTFTGSGKKA